MFWGFLLRVLYLGTNNQLFQILHALCLWQKTKQNNNSNNNEKKSLEKKETSRERKKV